MQAPHGTHASTALAVVPRVAPCDHLVQFYEDDAALIEPISRFIRAGVEAGEPVVIIASAARRGQLAPAIDHALVTALDAADTLAAIMADDDTPSWARFRDEVGAVIARAGRARPGAIVRAYSELADLLWQTGRDHAAITLESYWNDLARSHACTRLCAYPRAHAHDRALIALQQRTQALEAALREARDREARYEEVVTRLVGHDLRSPLGAMMMAADCVGRLNLDDRANRHAARIAASAARMSEMIDQLLDYTRISLGGGAALVLGDVDLGELAEAVLGELEVEVAVARTGDLRGRWDADCLAQVLTTVIGNAVAHGDAAIQLTGEADEVVARVHNTGALSAAALARLFEPGGPDRKRHRSRGLGLGLFVARAFVAAHGGAITATSDEAGTTIRIALPRGATGAGASP
jgi:signal transduction histidine kinase